MKDDTVPPRWISKWSWKIKEKKTWTLLVFVGEVVSVQTLHVETLKTDIGSEHQTRKEPTSGSFYQISLLFSTSSSDNPFIKPGWRMSSRGALRRRWRRSRRGGVVKDGGDLGQCGEKAVSCWKSPLWPSFPCSASRLRPMKGDIDSCQACWVTCIPDVFRQKWLYQKAVMEKNVPGLSYW